MTANEVYSQWATTVHALMKELLDERPEVVRDYKPITKGGDRHGAMEWMFYSQGTSTDPLDRLASVGVIPQPSSDRADLEFSFGARLGDRYTRKIASYLDIQHKDLGLGEIAKGIEDAVMQAEALTEEDLGAVIPNLSW
ncbi:hypothetical protein ACFY1P_32705 [Streptomyces sp. NPDC001407]|uniref:hypothetical protein n=1 Tax=Streptomyces sp. NPDC001407 TaxID=3364573 RepID=UPI0036A5B359